MNESIQVIDAVHSQEIPSVDGVGNVKVVLASDGLAADRGVEVVSVGGPAPADVPLLRKVDALSSRAEPSGR